MQAEGGAEPDWRDGAAYAPLLGADRSLFAWEWLRRDPSYRSAAADHALAGPAGGRCEDSAAAAFGLVRFEAPELGVPDARPLWRLDVHPLVLGVERAAPGRLEDSFALDRLRGLATVVPGGEGEHLLLSDGLRAIRLDAPCGTFSGSGARLRYRLEGLDSAEPALLAVRRFLALCRRGRFAPSLHPPEARARRWVLLLRAWDGLSAGACQREIAQALLSRSAAEPCWRSREASIRSQAQRLVHGARQMAAGGYRRLLLA